MIKWVKKVFKDLENAGSSDPVIDSNGFLNPFQDALITTQTEVTRVGVEAKKSTDEIATYKDYVIEQGLGHRKWFSGTMEQWGSTTGTMKYSSAQFGYHYYTVPLGNYPRPFVGLTPTAFVLPRGSDQLMLNAENSPGTIITLPEPRVLHQTAGRTDRLTYYYYAVGRWKV